MNSMKIVYCHLGPHNMPFQGTTWGGFALIPKFPPQGQRLNAAAPQIVKEHFELNPKPSMQFSDPLAYPGNLFDI